jgi:HNH endonuclease
MLYPLRLIGSVVREYVKIKRRSPQWERVRNMWLAAHPRCAACNSTEYLQVHHVIPYHVHPELELKFENLMTLCMGPLECHLRLGHGGAFSRANAKLAMDVFSFKYASDAEREQITRDAVAHSKK